MNRLFDLRFMIGLFFLIVGLLLIIYGFASGNTTDREVNLWCGLLFTIFGATFIFLSKNEAEQSDE